jgi:hypothetical protein
MCTRAGETYVLGGLDELTSYLRRNRLIEPSHKGTWKPTELLAGFAGDEVIKEYDRMPWGATDATTFNGDDNDAEC